MENKDVKLIIIIMIWLMWWSCLRKSNYCNDVFDGFFFFSRFSESWLQEVVFLFCLLMFDCDLDYKGCVGVMCVDWRSCKIANRRCMFERSTKKFFIKKILKRMPCVSLSKLTHFIWQMCRYGISVIYIICVNYIH